MEDLKRRLMALVPEDRHKELDEVFNSWLSNLKVHTIPDVEEENYEEPLANNEQPEKVPLKVQVEALKKQIGKFKEKMKAYKESESSSTELALQDVKTEIQKVKEEISKLRLTFAFDDQDGRHEENIQLIQKLDEVKQFLEKLK